MPLEDLVQHDAVEEAAEPYAEHRDGCGDRWTWSRLVHRALCIRLSQQATIRVSPTPRSRCWLGRFWSRVLGPSCELARAAVVLRAAVFWRPGADSGLMAISFLLSCGTSLRARDRDDDRVSCSGALGLESGVPVRSPV